MAGEFLHSHGIDIDAEMARIQFGHDQPSASASGSQDSHCISTIRNVSLPKTPSDSRWDVALDGGNVVNVSVAAPAISASASQGRDLDGRGCLLAPSLCHPHVHLDKAFLLSHPKYSHLQIQRGDFQEAMQLTGKAKSMFEEDDLLERGRRLIDESVDAGVTHMRAFVEADAGVGRKCLDAGLKLRREASGRCMVQLCAFAQLPLYTAAPDDPDGSYIRSLMQTASKTDGVDALGSTPYVEEDRTKMEKNVAWMIDLAIASDLHLDFHLDYNLDPNVQPLVWKVVNLLKEKQWNSKTTNKTVVLGHCTRLTLFQANDWRWLREQIGDLRISFVGLPTSDLFMMRTPERVRGTLDVPELIKEYKLNACLGINNIGNAFTPQGSCDPLTLACNGVGVYQASTFADAEMLYECVSTRARTAIGFGGISASSSASAEVAANQEANLLLFAEEKIAWRSRRDIPQAVQLYDHARGRRSILRGRLVGGGVQR